MYGKHWNFNNRPMASNMQSLDNKGKQCNFLDVMAKLAVAGRVNEAQLAFQQLLQTGRSFKK